MIIDADFLARLRATTSDGSLPRYTSWGCYPFVYYTVDEAMICPTCANDVDTSDPVATADIHYEGDEWCDDCGAWIECAYHDHEDEQAIADDRPSW